MKNNELLNKIYESFKNGNNSHAFLLSTNNVDRMFYDVKELVKKIETKSVEDDNLKTNILNMIEKEENPDVLFIKPDGKEIKKDQILEIIRMFSTKPMISEYSIYIISNVDKMNDSSANKILKFLEEPEKNIIGFFITDKIHEVILTIKSRCEIYNINYESNNLLDYLDINIDEFEKNFDDAKTLTDKMNGAPTYILMNDAKNLAKKERTDIAVIFGLLKRFYVLKYEYINNGKYKNVDCIKEVLDLIYTNDINLIVKRINLLDNIINDFKINVNKELIFNKLFLLWK